MVENTDDIEQKMTGCNDNLPKMKRLAGILKTKFTNGCGDAASILSRLQRNLDDGEHKHKQNNRWCTLGGFVRMFCELMKS